MSETKEPVAAFISSLLGGICITGAGIVSMTMTVWGSGMMSGSFGGMRSMMGGISGMMGQQGFGVMAGLGILELISGIIVLVSAFRLNSYPEQASTWGSLILVFSIISLFGGSMGGYLIGAFLGIIGGALALSYKRALAS